MLKKPLQARVVRTQLEGAVKQVRAEQLETVHHGQQLQQVGGVRPLRGRQFAGLIRNGVEGTVVIGLLENARNRQFGSIRRQASRTSRVPDTEHRG